MVSRRSGAGNDEFDAQIAEIDVVLASGAAGIQLVSEDQLKIAYDALAKAEMSGDIRKQELALAAIDLINGDMNESKKPLKFVHRTFNGTDLDFFFRQLL